MEALDTEGPGVMCCRTRNHECGTARQKVAKMYLSEGHEDKNESEAAFRRDVQIQETARVYADAYNQLLPPKQATDVGVVWDGQNYQRSLDISLGGR